MRFGKRGFESQRRGYLNGELLALDSLVCQSGATSSLQGR